MSKEKDFRFLNIDTYSSTPKYLQLSDCIISAIDTGKLKRNDPLPSINDLSYLLDISRDTTEKGYRHLKNIGVITSVPGKGFYISDIELKKNLRICLMFNKLSSHKKIVYDAFVANLGDNVTIDFYIYNNDYTLFKKLVNNKLGGYSHYVIIPHFLDGVEEAYKIINTLPKEKLIIIDKKIESIDGNYAAIYENFEKDIYNALKVVLDKLQKYDTIKVIFPSKSYYPKEILKGIKLFCNQYAFNYKVINNIEDEEINNGEVYICVMEDDLVTLLEKVIDLGFKVGKDVGIISYNETPLKKFLLNGITTVSTDFKQMGIMAAQTVMENSVMQKEVPFSITVRSSI